MWPWRTRIEPVTWAEAGDDATASLAMILRYHKKQVRLDEVRCAIHADGALHISAGSIVGAAKSFGLRATGLEVFDAHDLIQRVSSPCIMHVPTDPALPARAHLESVRDGFFAVVEKVSPYLGKLTLIDPQSGDREELFLRGRSGILLLFEPAHALPVAKLISQRK
ncbi:MAG TPA: cysteine peptidase family C39 domain-containing protein [Kofleriaceae bacterium]|nr:cysteine peptidase family C39 domain-containing protein [Kofleriaceae bacterium]